MRESIAEQRRQYDLSRSDFAPYRETGVNALAQYSALYGIGRGSGDSVPRTIEQQVQTSPGGTRRVLNPNYNDANEGTESEKYANETVAPTMRTMQVANPEFQEGEAFLGRDEMDEARGRFRETPGYNFRFDEGVRAMDRSASSRGRLQGGGYGRELTRYGQGVGADEFNNYANRLAGIAGMGQGATQSTATLGANSASGISNTLMAGGRMQGDSMMSAGTARASGFAGVGNAFSGGVENWLTYQRMQQQPQSGGPI